MSFSPMTKAELQQAYRIGRSTLQRWLRDAGVVTGKRHFIHGPELAKVFEKYGRPNSIK